MSNDTTDISMLTPRQLRSAFRPEPNANCPEVQSISVSTARQQETSGLENFPQQTMRPEAPSFVPSARSNIISNEKLPSSPLIFDLKKYKYDSFISKLSCNFERSFDGFSSPRGICTLENDRLLVANFDHDSLILLDIQGTVYEIYKNLPNPKDVLYNLPNQFQAAVATKKEMIILDLQTKKTLVHSKLKGFYPWNIQYLQEPNIFLACDPSAERIVFFDKDLSEIGNWSFTEPCSDPRTYKKIYPYAACFFPDNTALVLTNRENVSELRECDVSTKITTKICSGLPPLRSYSIYGDSKKTCLIADKDNNRLILFNENSIMEEYKYKSMQEPYAMTFLSNGTLCVTTWNQSYGTNGGIAVISETDLKNN